MGEGHGPKEEHARVEAPGDIEGVRDRFLGQSGAVQWQEHLANGGIRLLGPVPSRLAFRPGDQERDGGDDQFTLVDKSMLSPQAQAIQGEIQEKLCELIEDLPMDASSLIRAVYFEGLTLQEAGGRLGISKAWASRLHAKTLQHLAHSLRSDGEFE